MDVLCSDKTGTMTEGVMRLHSAVDAQGKPWEKVGFFAYLNAFFQTGYKNPIDNALTGAAQDSSAYTKLGELPYDFLRKRLSVLLQKENQPYLITKGALENILAVCTQVELGDGQLQPLAGLQSPDQRFIFGPKPPGLSGFRGSLQGNARPPEIGK